MKNLLKTSTRLLAAITICAALSACGQPASLSSNFASSGSQVAVSGQFTPLSSPLSIMDY